LCLSNFIKHIIHIVYLQLLTEYSHERQIVEINYT